MKLRAKDHLLRPWRIHDVAHGFEVEDVWSLDTPGGPEDFDRLIDEVWSSFDRVPSGGARLLWAVRWRLGDVLGWDLPAAGLGGRVTSLRDELPHDLDHARLRARTAAGIPLSAVYQLRDEWVAELANATVHGVLHLGWVSDVDHRYRGQLAVLVRPNGWTGRLYLAAIRPFRWVIYPVWIRRMERAWTG